LAARFVDPALWNKAVQDEGEDNLDQFYLSGGMGINSLSRKIENIEGRDHEILTQIHAMAEQKKKTFWQRLFGR